ncbi:MAG TPA: hypothetical protein PL110_03180 [Candidatus Eremiobacteraeota bacterium]|nr:hypothetical protein [Candidatus Eremiobacteraeota bacterium]
MVLEKQEKKELEKSGYLQEIPEDDIFIKNFLRLYETLDKEQIDKDIQKLKQLHPDRTPEELVEVCVSNFAKKNSLWGGISAMPGSIPGFGTIVQLGTALADSFALIRSHAILILGISSLYGFDPYSKERIMDILIILSGKSEIPDETKFKTEVIKSGGARMVKNILAGMSGCFCRRSIFRFLPIAGIVMGGAMNYFSTKETGKRAGEFYGRKRHRHREGRGHE